MAILMAALFGLPLAAYDPAPDPAQAALYCSVPAFLGGYYGPDSDTWRVSSAISSTLVPVGDLCRQHDRCYSGAWGQFRSQCDDYFHTVLRQRCYNYFDVSGPYTKQSHCLGIAWEWWAGVRYGGSGNWGGPPSYNN
ncbi:hypothetical protein M8I35_04355 [Micromonospora sp. MSM11]|nr:hypothetical protein [Micromonospora sp. MSM11]MCL7456409.1 hypothetical protein [Micromonospora sp. MSM11]